MKNTQNFQQMKIIDSMPAVNIKRKAAGVKKFHSEYSSRDIDYWNEILQMVEFKLTNYINTDYVKNWQESSLVRNPPVRTPREVVEGGIAYFRFSLRHRKTLGVGLLCEFMGVDIQDVLRMERRSDSNNPYTNDVYKPIIRTFKRLLVNFHETVGNLKLNPGMNIFMLKSMRDGFEERIDIETNQVEGLNDEERLALRNKVRSFSERK